MHAFTYLRPESWPAATASLDAPGGAVLGGGTDLIPLLRDGRVRAERLVDIRGIPGSSGIDRSDDGSWSIGATTTLRDIAEHDGIRDLFPMLSDAARSVGSFALRHMGTLGGNLCQQMRCWYYRGGHECLRLGGRQCSAIDGENQYHAIMPQGGCVAVHPSDVAVALTALGAEVDLLGPLGARTLSMEAFLVPSRVRLDHTTALRDREIVTCIRLPETSGGGAQHFEKVMQRSSWDFALASVAGHRRRDGTVRLVLGGVANTPWRVGHSIEEDVASGGLSEDDLDTLAQRALYDAEPLSRNQYKVHLAMSALRRAMQAVQRT